MKYGFKVQVEHKFDGFTIYEIIAPIGHVYFLMPIDQVSIGTYYDGSMTITEAFDPTIIGWVLTGWQNKPQLDTKDAWYGCDVTTEMKNWLCVHSDKYTHCEVTGDGPPSATVNGISFWLS